jgi:hypothetical protein
MDSWTKSDFKTVLGAAEVYAACNLASGPAHFHPWRGVRNEALEPIDLERIADFGLQAAMKLRELDKTAKFVAPLLLSGEPNSLASIACLNRFVELLACAPENCAEVVARLHHLSASQLTRAKEMIVEAAHLVTGIAAEAGAFHSVALEAEAASVRTRLAAGASWFKRWTRAYRDASAELASWLTDPLPKSAAERISFVDRLIGLKAKRNQFEGLSQEAQAIFGPLWHREATD